MAKWILVYIFLVGSIYDIPSSCMFWFPSPCAAVVVLAKLIALLHLLPLCTAAPCQVLSYLGRAASHIQTHLVRYTWWPRPGPVPLHLATTIVISCCRVWWAAVIVMCSVLFSVSERDSEKQEPATGTTEDATKQLFAANHPVARGISNADW